MCGIHACKIIDASNKEWLAKFCNDIRMSYICAENRYNVKRWFLYILFLFPVVVLANMTDMFPMHSCQSASEQALVSDKADDQTLSVCVAANSYADVSSQQSNTFGSNLMRRYRPGGFSVDKLFDFLIVGQNDALINSYKNNLCSSREYFAMQKLAGYYIYTLCKIII